MPTYLLARSGVGDPRVAPQLCIIGWCTLVIVSYGARVHSFLKIVHIVL